MERFCCRWLFVCLALFSWTFAVPLALADEGAATVIKPLENAADFVNLVNDSFPGLVSPSANRTSAEAAGTGAPSGQAQNPEPAADTSTWQEYLNALDGLNADVEAGRLTEGEWQEKTQEARARFIRGEKQRGHGFNRNPLTGDKTIDTRAIQIEKNLIDVGNSQQND